MARQVEQDGTLGESFAILISLLELRQRRNLVKKDPLREGLAFQKKWDWEVRSRMLPLEVLAVSSASDREKAFLLGMTHIDPNPCGEITYPELIPSDQVLVLDESIDIGKPVIPPARDGQQRDGITGKVWEVVDLFSLRTTDFSRTLERQAMFDHAVFMANMVIAEDIGWDQWSALTGRIDRYGKPYRDPQPDRLPVYHRLIAGPTTLGIGPHEF